ncbi:MAG: transporter substrate-binding domain-containing protein [Desulfobulbaceae bacterium]|nr:transporter substrate-binding domain-containing protein [Desulfobulbaceae bacterium]
MYLRLIIIFFIPLFAFPVFAAPKGIHPLIKVAVFPLEPLNFTDQNGEAKGLNPDIIREIAREEEWTVEFVPGSWAEGLSRLQSEEIDLMTTIAYSPERAEKMDFSHEPVTDIWGQIFTQPGKNINTILDLNGRHVAIMSQDINGQNFIKTAEKFGVVCKTIEFPTHNAIFEAIKDGKVIAGVAPQHFGLRHAADYNLVATSIQFSPFSIYFATKKGKGHDILEHIDSHLSRWKQDRNSFYYKRLSYWMGGKEFEKQIIPTWLLITFSLALALTALLFFINRALNIKVHNRTKEILLREKQYRDLVESANTIILRWDRECRVLFMNKFGLDLFGYSFEEVIGHHVTHTIVPAQESTGKSLKFMMDDILKNPEKYILNENENICKDGRRVFIQWSNRVIYDDDGNFQEMLSVGTDITDRKRLETELFQAQKMESMGTLAGGVAHDFNNILSIIFGYVELSKIQKEDPDKVAENLEEILRAAQRAQALVRQILTFSRKSDSAKQILQVSILVKEVLKMLHSTLPVTIEIKQDIASHSTVFGDPTQIHQVIMNLCTNAYHAMEETGGTLTVSLKDVVIQKGDISSSEISMLQGEYIKITIQDTGSGINPKDIQKIFEPYFTTKELGKGTGMGLAVVHGIVRAHNGQIKIDSIPGEGTAFHVFLPIDRNEDHSPNSQIIKKEVRGNNEKILLVDDEAKIAESQAKVLQEYGYKVEVFTDSTEALKRFKENPDQYDILITDMTMPGLTGVQLSQEIFLLKPGFPIIMWSGFNKLMNKEKAMELGISEYLHKPVLKETLLGAVSKVLVQKTQ